MRRWAACFVVLAGFWQWSSAEQSPEKASIIPDNNSWFVMTSHREPNQTDGLHLGVSQDGLKWQVVNQDRSVLKPTVGEVFRYPSIARDESGTYHLVWTIAWGCATFKGIG